MKRVVSLILAVICILSTFLFVSCDDKDSVEKVAKLGGKTPVQVVEAAIPGLKDFILNKNIYIESEFTATVGDDNMTSELVILGREGYFRLTEGNLVNELIAVDGIIYMEETGEKYKMPYEEMGFDDIEDELIEEVDEIFEIVGTDEYDYIVYMVKESGLFDDLKFEKSGSKYTLKLDLVKLARKALDNPDAIADVLPDDLLDDFNEMLSEKNEIEQMLSGVEKAVVTIQFNSKGVVTEVSAVAKLDITIDGQRMAFDGSAKVSLTPGSAKSKIKKPADASSYTSYFD